MVVTLSTMIWSPEQQTHIFFLINKYPSITVSKKGTSGIHLTFSFAKDRCYYTVGLSFTLILLGLGESKITYKTDLDAH